MNFSGKRVPQFWPVSVKWSLQEQEWWGKGDGRALCTLLLWAGWYCWTRVEQTAYSGEKSPTCIYIFHTRLLIVYESLFNDLAMYCWKNKGPRFPQGRMPDSISTAIIDSCLIYMTSCSLKCSEDGNFSRFKKTPAKKIPSLFLSVYSRNKQDTDLVRELTLQPPGFFGVSTSILSSPG